MGIFEMTKTFPIKEKYSLIDQIRRSSRAVSICSAEGYRKRSAIAHFVAKTNDRHKKNTEEQGWVGFSLACNYINQDVYQDKMVKSEGVGGLLNNIIRHPERNGSKQVVCQLQIASYQL